MERGRLKFCGQNCEGVEEVRYWVFQAPDGTERG